MKMHCDIIKDLIPSYVDGICSEKTRELVEEHLCECEACHRIVLEIKSEELSKIEPVVAKKPWLKVKRRSSMKSIFAFLIAPIICIGLFIGWCTLSGEGLTLDALLYRNEANAFLHYLSDSDYEQASEYLSFYGCEDVVQERVNWIKDMEELDLNFSEMRWTPLYAEDGLVYRYVTVILESGETLEFRLLVQGKGLSLYSIYVHNNEKLTERIQKMMTSHNPG